MNEGMFEIKLGVNDEIIDPVKGFKAVAGTTYRASLAWWPGIESPDFDAGSFPEPSDEDDNAQYPPSFAGAKTVYIPGVGKVVANDPRVAKLGNAEPKPRYGTAIVLWPLGDNGKPDVDRLQKGWKPVVKPWVFNHSVFETIRTIHLGNPLYASDLTITCENSEYQKLGILPVRKCILREILTSSKYPELSRDLKNAIREVIPAIKPEIAKNLSIDEIEAKLGSSRIQEFERGKSDSIDKTLNANFGRYSQDDRSRP